MKGLITRSVKSMEGLHITTSTGWLWNSGLGKSLLENLKCTFTKRWCASRAALPALVAMHEAELAKLPHLQQCCPPIDLLKIRTYAEQRGLTLQYTEQEWGQTSSIQWPCLPDNITAIADASGKQGLGIVLATPDGQVLQCLALRLRIYEATSTNLEMLGWGIISEEALQRRLVSDNLSMQQECLG